MTGQRDFFSKVIELLEKAHIPYMLSGSLASSYLGQPRATNDIDIVIDPTESQLSSFISLLGSRFYVSSDAALQALEDRTMFNIIDNDSGWKADLIIKKTGTYSRHEFDRRQSGELMGVNISLVSPEDAILSKLWWSSQTQSPVQMKDALGVMAVQWKSLDWKYLETWADKLQLSDSLKKLKSQAKAIVKD